MHDWLLHRLHRSDGWLDDLPDFSQTGLTVFAPRVKLGGVPRHRLLGIPPCGRLWAALAVELIGRELRPLDLDLGDDLWLRRSPDAAGQAREQEQGQQGRHRCQAHLRFPSRLR
jgi:hypothetical protein